MPIFRKMRGGVPSEVLDEISVGEAAPQSFAGRQRNYGRMGEYYPSWEPSVSRLRATPKWYFLPSEPPQHIVATHIFDFTINLLIVVHGELQMQYHQIIYKEVFLCLRRQKSEVFWNFWEKI